MPPHLLVRTVQVWSSTFDPGRNANLQRKSAGGGSYYDKPVAGDTKTVWDCHLESKKSGGGEAPAPVSAPHGNVVDAAELKRMMSSERVEAAMRQAGSGGKVDFNKVRRARPPVPTAAVAVGVCSAAALRPPHLCLLCRWKWPASAVHE